MSSLLCLGVIGKAHGICGACQMRWFSESLKTVREPLLLAQKALPMRSIVIRKWQMHHETMLIYLDEIEDRTSAEQLRGAEILIDRQYLPPTNNDEYYIQDLLGCQVFLVDGSYLGEFVHLECTNARSKQVLWSIKTAKGDFLFPAQPQFIVSCQPENKKIIIDPPLGLVEACTS